MDGDQVLRHLLDALAHAGLRATPGRPAQVAELGGMAFGWRVTLDLVQPVQGNIDRVPAGVLDDQVVALEALDREATESQIAADAVLDVHDIIADLHLFEGFEERGALGERRGFVPPAFGEQLVFRDDRERERGGSVPRAAQPQEPAGQLALHQGVRRIDRKSTRLNSSHSQISYAVFCLKKKNTNSITHSYTASVTSTCSFRNGTS